MFAWIILNVRTRNVLILTRIMNNKIVGAETTSAFGLVCWCVVHRLIVRVPGILRRDFSLCDFFGGHRTRKIMAYKYMWFFFACSTFTFVRSLPLSFSLSHSLPPSYYSYFSCSFLVVSECIVAHVKKEMRWLRCRMVFQFRVYVWSHCVWSMSMIILYCLAFIVLMDLEKAEALCHGFIFIPCKLWIFCITGGTGGQVTNVSPMNI